MRSQRLLPSDSPNGSRLSFPARVATRAASKRFRTKRRTSERRSGSGSSVAVLLWSSRSSSAGAETFMRSCLHHRPIRMRSAGRSPIRSGPQGQARQADDITRTDSALRRKRMAECARPAARRAVALRRTLGT